MSILGKPHLFDQESLHDIQPAIAFAAAEEFSRANADKILIGHAAVAAFTKVIFDSRQRPGTIRDPQATIGG